MKHLFFGGIHPADKKELSAGSSLVTIMHPRQVKCGHAGPGRGHYFHVSAHWRTLHTFG